MKKCLIIIISLCLLVGCSKDKEQKNLLDPSDVIDTTNQMKHDLVIDASYDLRKQVELFYIMALFKNDEFRGTKFICDGKECSNETDKLDLNIVPSSGKITIDESGSISFIDIVIDGYKCVIRNSGNINCEK